MKITICAYDAPGNIDGPTAWLKRLLPYLKENGFEIRIIFFANRDKNLLTYQYFLQAGFSCKIIYWDKFNEEKISELLQELKQYTPDIFIPNYFPIAMEVAAMLKPFGMPVVMALHNDNDFHYALVKEYAGITDAIVAVSGAIEEMVKDIVPQHAGLHMIPYGAPIPSVTTVYNGGVLKLVYAGRLIEHQKKISEVTKGLCRVAAEIPGTECTIYGSGKDASSVKAIIASGNNPHVKFMGRLDSTEVQKHLLENHVFVLLSDYEGTPIALMEAMACGLVPICNNVKSGMTELVTHQQNGMLVNDRSAALVEAVRFIKDHPEEWNRMSAAARKKIQDEYSEEACNRQWFNLLLPLVKKTNLSAFQIPTIKEIRNSFIMKEAFLPHSNPSPPFLMLPVYKTKKWIGRMKRKFID